MSDKPDTSDRASVTGRGEFEAATGPDREFVGASGWRAYLQALGPGLITGAVGPSALWALVAGALITVLLAAGSFLQIARVFKVLCVALLAYVAVPLLIRIPWQTVALNTVVPHIQLSSAYIALLVAVLGTTISPYLFFWQAMHRVEDMQEEDLGGERAVPLRRRTRRAEKSKLLTSRFDVFAGMAFSQVVLFAIITATAATLRRRCVLWQVSSVRRFSPSASSARACSLCPSSLGRDLRRWPDCSAAERPFPTRCAKPRCLRPVRRRDDRRHGTQPARREPDQAADPRGGHPTA
jgi:hypothetical protein